MNRPARRICSVCLLVCFFLVLTVPSVAAESSERPSSEASQRIAELLHDPDKARTFDYCQWRFKNKGSEEELPDFETLLERERSTVPGPEVAATSLANAGTTVALKAQKRKKCESIFKAGTDAEAKAYAKAERRMDRRGPKSPASEPALATIQTEIKRLWREDQAARRSYIESRTEDKEGADYWQRALAAARTIQADTASTAYIRTTIDTVDWIDSHRFGEDISAHAWILVQHADADPAFQADVLERMGKYLDNDGVRKRDYAYLWDRVAVNHDREQRYGTQPDWECKPGGLTLMPVEDEANLDARRAKMDLGPAANDLADMTKAVCGG